MKWEYTIERLTAGEGLNVSEWDTHIRVWLNMMGEDGWELVKYEGNGSFMVVALFKRPVRG